VTRHTATTASASIHLASTQLSGSIDGGIKSESLLTVVVCSEDIEGAAASISSGGDIQANLATVGLGPAPMNFLSFKFCL